MNSKLNIDKGWALFLDRDGVINKRLPDEYVKQPDEFEFLPGVTQALAILSGIFNPIIVVTNQQGIGKGLMTSDQLHKVHNKMIAGITEKDGRIDQVFFSPDLNNSRSFSRKPSVGMGLSARKQFPSIRFRKSIMAGDSYSDILFGHRLGMTTVLIGNDNAVIRQCDDIVNYRFDDLLGFARAIEINRK